MGGNKPPNRPKTIAQLHSILAPLLVRFHTYFYVFSPQLLVNSPTSTPKTRRATGGKEK